MTTRERPLPWCLPARSSRRRRRVATAAAATLAILLQLFAPAISQALAGPSDPTAREICSAHAQPARSDDPAGDARPEPPCLYCGPHLQPSGGSPVPPALPARTLAVAGASPRSMAASALGVASWMPGQPRAPPRRYSPSA